MNNQPKPCQDCEDGVDRRSFIRAVGGAAALAVASNAFVSRFAHAAPKTDSKAESAVARLYKSLNDEQKKTITFDFDHELRRRINANWHVTKPTIGDSKFYTDEQRKIVEEIVKNVTSEDGYARLVKQMEDDDGGLQGYSMAIFGKPDSGKFEWELTGRHLTLRADGNSVDKAAFGGPIVYGHGEESVKSNLFYYQTQQVNEVFKALDAKQAAKALNAKAPVETDVDLQGTKGKFAGIPVSDLSSDQKALVEKTLKLLMAPYRTEDVEEAMAIIKESGGLDKLHFAFYQQEDLGSDKTWDIWRVEGPSLVWHFRGAPHVHAYINVGITA